MLFQTHLLLGVIFFLLVGDLFHGGNNVIFFFLLLLGSVFPDIDEPHSKINQWSGIVGRIITFFFQHRTIFHSLFLHVIIFFGIQYVIGTYYASAVFLGYLAHILGDSMTPMGVQIFYPFSRLKVNGPIRVGSELEVVIMIVLMGLIVWKIIY